MSVNWFLYFMTVLQKWMWKENCSCRTLLLTDVVIEIVLHCEAVSAWHRWLAGNRTEVIDDVTVGGAAIGHRLRDYVTACHVVDRGSWFSPFPCCQVVVCPVLRLAAACSPVTSVEFLNEGTANLFHSIAASLVAEFRGWVTGINLSSLCMRHRWCHCVFASIFSLRPLAKLD